MVGKNTAENDFGSSSSCNSNLPVVPEAFSLCQSFFIWLDKRRPWGTPDATASTRAMTEKKPGFCQKRTLDFARRKLDFAREELWILPDETLILPEESKTLLEENLRFCQKKLGFYQKRTLDFARANGALIH